MYIASIRLQNYRCFKDSTINFTDGLNVIIGENNAGKTTTLKAIGLIFDRSHSNRLTEDDFFRGITEFDSPPEIIITLKLKETDNESADDKAVVASWITSMNHPWEATLTYKYLLPERHIDEYKAAIKNTDKTDEKWEIIAKFIPKYKSYLYGGEPTLKNQAESEWLDKFDYKLLGALRDVESEMFTGKNPLLKRMLKNFLDYSIKTNKDKNDDKKRQEIEQLDQKFQETSRKISKETRQRINLNEILELAKKTGAEDGGKIDFGGSLSQVDVLSALKLMVKQTGFDIPIPIINNGLGYNNLVYISFILSELALNQTEEYGENSTVFPLLLIEEPEAHLHPALQYRVLKFITREVKDQKYSRQIFVTTHSSHITAATPLDSIICMSLGMNQEIIISYPGRVFDIKKKEDLKSKKYVERFLDATKSAMLFAKGILLVEGIAEQLIIPVLAEYILKDKENLENKSLEDFYISIIGVGGSTFSHFLKLFDYNQDNEFKKNALRRKVASLIDPDPARKNKNKEKSKARFEGCFPFEIGINDSEYEYRTSPVIKNLEADFLNHNIRLFYSKEIGKTLEYDLAYCNCDSPLFVVSDKMIEIPKECDWGKEEKKQAKFAASYFNSIKKEKGENAYDLSNELKSNLELMLVQETNDTALKINIPKHIKQAIEWLCALEEKNG